MADSIVDNPLAPFIEDFPYYAERCLKIQTMKGALVPFAVNTPQGFLEEIVRDIKSRGELVRLVILKARREGVSTWVSGRFFWQTSTDFNRYAMTVTHEPQASDFIFKMTKRFYDNCPEILRPQVKYNNTRLLEFNAPDGKGLDSAFRVGTAEKDELGSGQMINYLHLCLHPDTPIIIKDGREKRLRDINIGDEVVTHNGNTGRVSEISRRRHEDMPNGKEALSIQSWLGYPVIMSPDHKVFTNRGWVMAKDLFPSHFLSMPIREIRHTIKTLEVENKRKADIRNCTAINYAPSSIELNEDVGFFIGYYLAEGSIKANDWGPCNISFALHNDEESFLNRAANAVKGFSKSGMKVKKIKGTKTTVGMIDNVPLAKMVDKYFGRVDEKHIPDWVFDCGEDFCRGLVAGYLAGDGSKGIGGKHQRYESNALSATSIRASLAYQIRDLVAALGYGWGCIRYKEGGVKYGRNCKPAWIVYFNGDCGQNLRKIIGIPYAKTGETSERAVKYVLDMNSRKVWLRIKKIRKVECDEFIDLAIDHPDRSFRTGHFSVSNSESAKYPRNMQTDLFTSLLQCVPDEPNTEVIIESTAKGIGGEFYDRYWGARIRYDVVMEDGKPKLRRYINEDADSENGYHSVFLPWYIFPDYSKEPSEGFELTSKERELKDLYGLTDKQIAWRRWCVENKCGGNEDTFAQEYPDCAESAFLSTGRPVFNNAKLLVLRDTAPKPLMRYDCQVSSGQWISKPNDGQLKVWDEPVPGKRYLIGADVAEGLVHGDASVADVIDADTGEQVAQYWSKTTDPDIFGRILDALGRRYNYALIAVERNNHGLTTITALNNLEYPEIYAETIVDPPAKPRKRYGWVTTGKNRTALIDTLVEIVRDNSHGIRCAETFGEMMAFKVQDNGRMEADSGLHDDRVMSYAIAQFVRGQGVIFTRVEQRQDKVKVQTMPPVASWG